MPLTARVYVQGLNELTSGFMVLPATMALENEKAMVVSTHLAEAEIKALTPRKTGRLFAAWVPDTIGSGLSVVGVVGDQVDYAPYVEEDTQPHDIYAHGGALMVPVAGGGGFGGGRLSGSARAGQQVAFFGRVHHPGTKGKHMAKRGLEAAKPAIVATFLAATDRAIKASFSKMTSAIRQVIV
jgi:hypothetical protein